MIENFHPSQLIPYIQFRRSHNRRPKPLWVFGALWKLPEGKWKGDYYVYYVDATNPNKPGSEWQFKGNLIVKHPEWGEVVIDLLKNERIGGLEFIDRIPWQRTGNDLLPTAY